MGRRKPKHHKRVVFHTPGRECPHADKGCCPSCLTGRPKNTLFSGPDRIVTVQPSGLQVVVSTAPIAY